MITLDAINQLDAEQFVATLGFAFEQSPWVAAEAWPARPFASVAALQAALAATVHRTPVEQQLALIRAHPDLAGKAAIAGELTRESTNEQASAGLDRLSPDEYAVFTQLNDTYRARFGFPFIIFVREHTKASILGQFRKRLGHTREQEIATALGEIEKIATRRLNDIVTSNTDSSERNSE